MRREAFVWKWAWVCVSLVILVLAAACGRNDSTGDASSSGGPVVATMPAAKFAAVAEQAAPGSTALTQTAVLTQTATVDAKTLERGATIYVNRKCGDCHGAQGEGVADKGSAVAGTKLTDPEFDNIMRTGDNGKLGPDHLYGPSAISPGGIEALHAWLQSLPSQ